MSDSIYLVIIAGAFVGFVILAEYLTRPVDDEE